MNQIIIKNITLITENAEVLPSRAVVIEEGIIAKITSASKETVQEDKAAPKVIDGTGLFLSPASRIFMCTPP